ncbi:glycosyltransferase [Fibrobacter sp.]|uniref:glycosyltransferase n=1 Tax=Fibrobacter sp. TaxID=35828 RepID=UPI0025BE79F8|nr:glycosyltransferase [Fibrobacter sp.]MBR3071809.1 glycosyltransferase [Fibrobacter sp.]
MSNSKQIRVCQVLHGIVGGGSEQVVLNYCSRMRDIHFDLLFQYDPNPQILERFNEAGFNCIQIPDKVHHPFKHLWTMFKMFRKGHYDVVHSHLDWYMNCYVCFLAMLAGIKKRIAHHHQAYSKWGLLCALFRIPCKLFATHWLACGEAAAINGWGKNALKKGKVTILPNAIDPERFKFSEKSRQEIRAKYGIKEDDFVIGHVGRFFPEKNHKFIVRLFERVLRQRSNCWLLLVGNGPLQQEIQEMVKKLGFENRVIFAGLQKDIVPYYGAMDVLLLPSTREAFPMTLVEAQYNGLPCVVSDAVPKETAITENVYPLLIDDIMPWCEKLGLMELVVNREQPQIKSGRFDIRTCYKMLESLYQIP